MYKNKKYIEIIEFILLISLSYSLVLLKTRRTDLMIIAMMFVINFIKKKMEKENVIRDKKILIVGLIWIFWISYRYFFQGENPENFGDVKQQFYVDLAFKSVLLCTVVAQMKFSKLLYEKLNLIILILSFYPIGRGLLLLLQNGVLSERWYIWYNPNYYSFLLGIFIIVGFIVLFYEKNKMKKYTGVVILILSSIVLITGPRSRNTIIALMIIGIVFLISKIISNYKKDKIKTIILLVFLASVLSMGYLNVKYEKRLENLTKISSIKKETRIDIYRLASKLIAENDKKITGKGFAYYVPNKLMTATEQVSFFHNDILEILYTQGIVGLVLFVSFIGYALKTIISKYVTIESQNEIQRPYIRCGLVLMFYFLLLGLFDCMIYNMRATELIFFYIGLACQESNKK